MSYRSWHTYGYGICADDISICSIDRLEMLLKHAPNYREKIHGWFKDCGIETPTVDDYLEFDQDFYLGLATLIKNVIEEAEGICLAACDDSDGADFVIYEPCYPWQMTNKDVGLTEEKLEQIFRRYVSILTDTPITIEYREVENGG